METETTDEEATDEQIPAPAGAVACTALGCRRTDGLEAVRRADGHTRVLCPVHRKRYLGVSS